MKTCSCNEHPLTPHFYIVKLGFTGVYFFLSFASKHRLWILVRTASMRRFLRVPTINVLSKKQKNIKNFHLKMSIFTAVKNCCKLHGRVCVMFIYIRHRHFVRVVSQGSSDATDWLSSLVLFVSCLFYRDLHN